MDISKLPKPALFNLIMQLEPREMRIVCGSKNHRVREICESDMFRKAYSEKYDLLKQPFEIEEDKKSVLTDVKGNALEINYKNDGKTFSRIIYTPFKQIYPSTFIKNFTEDELRRSNPITIYYFNEDNKITLYIGRSKMHEVLTEEEEEKFLYSFNKEIKEFLEYIGRKSWWNSNIQFGDDKVNENIAKEFIDEIQDLLNKTKK